MNVKFMQNEKYELQKLSPGFIEIQIPKGCIVFFHENGQKLLISPFERNQMLYKNHSHHGSDEDSSCRLDDVSLEPYSIENEIICYQPVSSNTSPSLKTKKTMILIPEKESYYESDDTAPLPPLETEVEMHVCSSVDKDTDSDNFSDSNDILYSNLSVTKKSISCTIQ